MRSIFYIGFAILTVQGVCNNTRVEDKKKADPIICESGSSQALHMLTWKHPAMDFNISLDSLKKINGALSVWVKEVTNPGLVPVNFQLLLSQSARQWPLTGFTLYPPDKPGVFNFNISETVKSIIAAASTSKNKQYSLTIMLDTTDFHKNEKAAAESLLIKVCSPVFK